MRLLDPITSPALRLWRYLDRSQALRRSSWVVPLAFGLFSLLLGQDTNWDLRNYHHYAPYALLHGRIGFDLAPAQWQSYFNPAQDLLYYGLNAALPAPLAGFIMGLLHGLNFVVVLGIARTVVRGNRRALLLALAGCLGAGFVAELGNSMGDNLIALFVLGALWLLLARWHTLTVPGAAKALIGAGLLAGLGTGFKLTNAIYALALCLALLSVPGSRWQRLRGAVVFGLATLAGIGASAGFWYWKMWQVYGNPLFPQFNNLFMSPMAAPVGIGDTRWLPDGVLERLLWPFIFTLHPARVIELPLHQLIWPIVYVLALVFIVVRLVLRRPARDGVDRNTSGQARMLLLFIGLAYVLWLNLFSIYRYLVPAELLAPLVVWLLLQQLLPAPRARTAAFCLLVVAMLGALPPQQWGHSRWNRQALRVTTPALPDPAQNLVFIVHGDPPMAWTAPFFPAQVAFISIGAGFPESPAYRARVRAMVAQRRGPFYVTVYHSAPNKLRLFQRARVVDYDAVNAARLASATDTAAQYGLRLDAATCRVYDAFMGEQRNQYRLCEVSPVAVKN